MRPTLTRCLLWIAASLCAACLTEAPLAPTMAASAGGDGVARSSVESGDPAAVVTGLRDRLTDAELQLAEATTPERLRVASPTDRERIQILSRAAAALAGDLDALEASGAEEEAWREAARSLDRRLEAVNRGLHRLSAPPPAPPEEES